MTATERIERPNAATTRDATNSPIAREAMQLMAAGDARRTAPSRTEPHALTLTDPYAGIADGAIGSCGTTPDCPSRRQFRPDPSLSTPGAREWQQRSQQQRRQGLEVAQDGRYEVKPGDSLWTIGERAARGNGSQRPSARDVQDSMRRILEANPDLKCNPNLLRRGQRLVIPDNVRPGTEAPRAPQEPNSSHEEQHERRPAQPPEARPAQPPEARPAQPPEARPAQPPEARPAQPPEASPAQPPEARPAKPESDSLNPECPPTDRTEKLPRKPHELNNPFDGRYQQLPWFIPNADLENLRRR